ncbi:DNA replication/repair protein RecF [Candidatus Epulonipiscium viviparus]|uniref:DNA replication/repair protein RecF n=1 Tax=Candidatus Epulonipiscium viviparus TaxID=420336 RepID=UPI0027380652|nr:DNA replication/repair protein RecF [Candidatus Epulopiscium viviparus]
MYISTLSLTNFRNYQNLSLSLSKGINIFFGDNAQGKTNVLEAIYLCATARSHRTTSEKEVIKWDSENALVNLMLTKQYSLSTIDFIISRRYKSVLVNKLPINKLTKLFGVLNVVFFAPENLDLIKKSPKDRRRFIDIELCQLDSMYVSQLSSYHKILKQRNCYLKQNVDNINYEFLDILDENLYKYAKKIFYKRSEFIKNLNTKAAAIHLELSGGKEHLKLIYEPNVDINIFKSRLKFNRDRDIRTKTTNSGPHRDDINFLINDHSLKLFGSQGQQRTCILSIKFAQIDIITEITGETPILLLDDILSELDINRQKYLFKYINNLQTMITCTGVDPNLFTWNDSIKVFIVEKANIICKN